MTESSKWAILIGINQYHESLGPLKYAARDCRRLAEVLTSGDDGFSPDRVLMLTDDDPPDRKPTCGNIHSWLTSWLSQPGEDDTVLLFFAGHGRAMDGKCYLAPGDATLQTIHVTGISVPYLQELLGRCKARQKILVLDACHSGAGSRDVAVMAAPMMDALTGGQGIYTLTSCDVDELSHEWEDKQHGVFTYYFAEALAGGCPPDAHGRVSVEAIYDWVYQRVRKWSANKRCSQNPRRISNACGTITLRQASPDWQKLAVSLQERLDSSEAANAKLEQRVSQVKERERLLDEVRKAARSRMESAEPPKTKADQKRFLADLAVSPAPGVITVEELLSIVADESERAQAIRQAAGESKRELSSQLTEARQKANAVDKYVRDLEVDKRLLLRAQGDIWWSIIFGASLALSFLSLLMEWGFGEDGKSGTQTIIVSMAFLGVGLGAMLFPWKGWRWTTSLSLAWLTLFALAFGTTVKRAPPTLAHIPVIGHFITDSYRGQLDVAKKALESGQIAAASTESQALIATLATARHPRLVAVRSAAQSIESRVAELRAEARTRQIPMLIQAMQENVNAGHYDRVLADAESLLKEVSNSAHAGNEQHVQSLRGLYEAAISGRVNDRLGRINELFDAGAITEAKKLAEDTERWIRAIPIVQATESHRAVLSLLRAKIWPSYFEEQLRLATQDAEAGLINPAHDRAQGALKELEELKESQLREREQQFRDLLARTILPAVYAQRRVWTEGDALLAWDSANSRVVRLTSGSSYSDITISPDGKRVAFVEGRDKRRLQVVMTDGTAVGNVYYSDYAPSAGSSSSLGRGWCTVTVARWNSATRLVFRELWPNSTVRQTYVAELNDQNGVTSITRLR